MGFPDIRAEKAARKTGARGLQPALDWIVAHSDDPDIDEPIVVHQGYSLGSTPSGPSPTTSSDTPAADLTVEEPPKKRQLTKEEREEAEKALQERLKRIRIEKQKQEQADKLAAEKLRREQGKLLQKAQEDRKDMEWKLERERKAKEKAADKAALAKIREQIRIDKERRKQANSGKPAQPVPKPAPVVVAAAKKPTDYDSCLLQIRLTNGRAIRGTFKPTDTINTVVNFINEKRTDGHEPFKLMTNFPKQVFGGEKYSMTLAELGLVPRGQLILTKM